jgi:hypothetical protein
MRRFDIHTLFKHVTGSGTSGTGLYFISGAAFNAKPPAPELFIRTRI